MDAPIVELPCGHRGRYIIGRFALCSVPGCDTRKQAPVCGKCGSARVEAFSAPPLVPPGSWHCWTCGAVWFGGV